MKEGTRERVRAFWGGIRRRLPARWRRPAWTLLGVTLRRPRTLLGEAMLRAMALLIVVMAVLWGSQHFVISRIDERLDKMQQWQPASSCLVYDRYGQLVDEFYVERRIWTPISEMSPAAWQAVVAAEDRRFFDHPGVDVWGIVRAVVANLKAGRIEEGGSTLSQQLVKNIVVGDEKSYRRKAWEAVVTWRLEQRLSKQEILELYLNYVYLGDGNYGVEAAARDYFGVSAAELDAGQAATLAALIPAPSRYNPRRNPFLATERRTEILEGMIEEGYISAEEAAAAIAQPVLPPQSTEPARPLGAGYLTAVRQEVRHLFGDRMPYQVGLHIYTSLDPEVQSVAEEAVKSAVDAVIQRQGHIGPLRRLESEEQVAAFLKEAPGLPRDAQGRALAPLQGACFEAMVTSLRKGTLRAGEHEYTLPPSEWSRLVRSRDSEKPARPLRMAATWGDVLPVCLKDGELALEDRYWADGAAIVVENRTGQVLAMVGGVDMVLEGYNNATQALRQPGSSFKPYVYTAALLNGHTQLDKVLDGPISFGGWSPKNYDGGYAGWLPMRTALAKSLNTVAVRLILEAGPKEVAALAEKMGVRSRLRPDLTMGLGSSEVTLLDQATGYSTIARMGVRIDPAVISFLEDSEGTSLGVAGGPVIIGGQELARLPGGQGERVLPAGVAYEMVDMMTQVVRAGTAKRALVEGQARAGKTGTTNEHVDAWFIGFTPQHTVAVWVGNTTDRTGLGMKETGGKTALPAWIQIVDALPVQGTERFPVPDEATLLPVGDEWVGLSRDNVPDEWLDSFPVDEGPLPDFPSGADELAAR